MNKHNLHIILTLICFAIPVISQSQENKIGSILDNDSTAYFDISGVTADEYLYVENHTDSYESFQILAFTKSKKWALIAQTPELWPKDIATGSGFITKDSYKYQFRSEKKMENMYPFVKPMDQLAILSSSGKKYCIQIKENGYNLIIRICKPNTENCLEPGIRQTSKNEQSSPSFIRERLYELKKLYDDGLITDLEYTNRKSEILKEL